MWIQKQQILFNQTKMKSLVCRNYWVEFSSTWKVLTCLKTCTMSSWSMPCRERVRWKPLSSWSSVSSAFCAGTGAESLTDAARPRLPVDRPMASCSRMAGTAFDCSFSSMYRITAWNRSHKLRVCLYGGQNGHFNILHQRQLSTNFQRAQQWKLI